MLKQGTATVVKHTGSHYLLSELPVWEPFPAVIKGKIRLEGSGATNPVAVGDRVDYSIDRSAGEPMGTIDRIHPRTNYIIRRSANLSRQSHIIAANLDRVFLLITMSWPDLKPAFVDRFLLTCEAYRIPAVLAVNKTDLHDAQLSSLCDFWSGVYSRAGYRVMHISALTGEGIDEMRELCRGSVSLFCGISGVGKSSVIQAIDPTLKPRIGEISLANRQGRHTTTFYDMHPFTGGGVLIDAPGIRGFGLVDIAPEELSTYFPEMLREMDRCRFKPCTHTHEPGCAVKQAVEEGRISAERYQSYLGMLEEEHKYR